MKRREVAAIITCIVTFLVSVPVIFALIGIVPAWVVVSVLHYTHAQADAYDRGVMSVRILAMLFPVALALAVPIAITIAALCGSWAGRKKSRRDNLAPPLANSPSDPD